MPDFTITIIEINLHKLLDTKLTWCTLIKDLDSL